MWFNKEDIKVYKPIYLDDLHGYILPHAGTKYTGNILSHTLRFRPKKIFNNIVIIYYPVNELPNVNGYHHEYYVLFKTLSLFYDKKNFISCNLLDKSTFINFSKINKKNTLYVLSVDFSHFISLQEALLLENCAANSIMFKNLNNKCTDVIDHIDVIKKMYKLLPSINIHWIGRTRSPGLKGVGYLSFLLRDKPNLTQIIPDGFFITSYDSNMNIRECLGNTNGKWNKKKEKELLKDVLFKSSTESRLSNGKYLNIPVKYYTITYLYKEDTTNFIRGLHAVSVNNTYFIPSLFLETTYENGKWIKYSDKYWKKGNDFDLNETIKKLLVKSGNKNIDNVQIYSSQVLHKEFK